MFNLILPQSLLRRATIIKLILCHARDWASRILHQPSALPRPFYVSPAVFILLLLGLLIWLSRSLLSIGEFPAIWAPFSKNGGILDLNQVKAGLAALVSSMAEQNLAPASPPPPSSSPFRRQGEASDSDDERDGRLNYSPLGIDKCPSVANLEAGGARILIEPNFLLRLGKMLPRLFETARVEMFRCTVRADAQRFSDLIKNFHAYPEGFPDASMLTKGGVCQMKIVTKLIWLICDKLDKQNSQLCQEQKEEYFEEVVWPHIKMLLDVAHSFGDARWTSDQIPHMLFISGGLVDIVFNIQQLSFGRPRLIQDDVDNLIVSKMVNAFRDIIENTAIDVHRSKEFTIHPATLFLIDVTELFSRDMVMKPEDFWVSMVMRLWNCWIDKLKEDAGRMFKDKNGQKYIFILNNTFFIEEINYRPLHNKEIVHMLRKLKEKYVGRYINKYWAFLTSVEGNSTMTPYQSLIIFIEEFDCTCGREMKWKVRPMLRDTLREKIKHLLHEPYELRLIAQSSESKRKTSNALSKVCMIFVKNKRESDIHIYTIHEFDYVIDNLFEGS